MTKEIRILGLLITDRIKEAGRTQEVLTRFAHIIKSRLGFHEVTEDVCSRVGVIILQLSGKSCDFDELEQALSKIEGLELRHMSFKV
jgi:ribosome biogenesis SPOUT family RNA methylase Rps3